MSASPSCTPPRRPLHERTSSQNNRLGIRLVPYSPPRISTDGSPSSRPLSYADASTETDPEPWPRCSSPLAPSSFYYESPSPTVWTKIRPAGAPDSRHSSRLATPESSSPWRPLTEAGDAEIDAQDGSVASSGELSPLQRPASQSSSRPSSARRKIINVHSDKTFSVHPQDLSTSSRTDSMWSAQPSFSTRNSSYGRQSFGTFSDDHPDCPSSPLTPLTERSAPKSPVSTISPHARSSPRVSPWNYRMIGGVRKVPKTPDLKQKQPQLSSASSTVPPLPSLPEIELTNPIDVSSTQSLNEKPSFQSTTSFQSRSTHSDRTNYKIHGQSSPVAVAELESLPASSIRSNYELLGGPSSTEPSIHDQTRPHTRESEANYVVHGGLSSASSVVAVRNRLNPEFSQESLVVPPLRPNKKRSWESFSLSKARSHDSVRTGSITSISTIMTQEATRALFVGPPTMLHQVGPNWTPSPTAHSKPQPAVRPHQWSSQLSTVFSESEGGSEPASRALSIASFADRRSSTHSKHILSMVSSLAGLEEHMGGPSHSRRASLEPPAATYNRNSPREPNSGTIRLICDHDEDGDGLGPLEELRHRNSRTRLGKMLSSYASDRSLRSTASFNAAVPTWAKVYYGSGERKWLAYKPSSESMFSNFSFTDSQPGGLSRSPSQDRHVSDIISPRRRPRDPVTSQGGRRESDTGSMDINPLSSHPVLAIVRNLKKQTSSIWSPHLGRDRRPIRYSIWDPPSADWEAKSELTGRRNAQVAMFVLGFIFPLAWMLAATIPIPLAPQTHDIERGLGTSKWNLQHENGGHSQLVDGDMYRSAIWWRNLNRGMSIIGLLMLGAVVALIVVGTRQGWGT
ncbi:hypothetical protein EDB81DRAFT_56232 [Dactylonectria macrodidyma]|uniref:Serine-rich protein n=1 Tax=Dactylonectria macrodidyma TaxID=307937 RepID=A0A9P9ENX1_9HYPO|nr:hypothetical protein EDB81DRAFT_56232 [Dactylonectria macrodidyma]